MFPWSPTSRRRFIALLISTSVMTATLTAAPHDQWDAVARLPPRTRVTVEERSGVRTSGMLQGSTDTDVTIETGDTPRRILRTSARRIVADFGTRRRQDAVWGLLVGAAAGAAVGGLTTRTNRLTWAMLLAAGWGAIGSIIGALNGSYHNRVVVYEAGDAR